MCKYFSFKYDVQHFYMQKENGIPFKKALKNRESLFEWLYKCKDEINKRTVRKSVPFRKVRSKYIKRCSKEKKWSIERQDCHDNCWNVVAWRTRQPSKALLRSSLLGSSLLSRPLTSKRLKLLSCSNLVCRNRRCHRNRYCHRNRCVFTSVFLDSAKLSHISRGPLANRRTASAHRNFSARRLELWHFLISVS